MEKLRPLALLLLRIGLGVIFIYNGYPKFVGRRLEHLDEMVHVNHLPGYFAYIAGVLEVGGGALLIAGLFTPITGLLLGGEMAIAMWKGEQFFGSRLQPSEHGPFLSIARCLAKENRRALRKAEHSLRAGF